MVRVILGGFISSKKPPLIHGRQGSQGLVRGWILRNRKRQWRRTGEVATTMVSLPTKNLLWRPCTIYTKLLLMPWFDDKLCHTPCVLTQFGNIIANILLKFFRMGLIAQLALDTWPKGFMFKFHWRQYNFSSFSLNFTRYSVWNLPLLPKWEYIVVPSVD